MILASMLIGVFILGFIGGVFFVLNSITTGRS